MVRPDFDGAHTWVIAKSGKVGALHTGKVASLYRGMVQFTRKDDRKRWMLSKYPNIVHATEE
eukprot:4332644-Prorocentrum_lima.AAC.1